MSWEERLLTASFKGVSFDVETVGDAGSRSIVMHEFPYVDGGAAEDMGLNPARVQCVAVIWGEAYEQQLQALLKALRSAEPGELVHPVNGTMPRAVCTQWQVEHQADARDAARLTLEFVESNAAVRVFTASSPIGAAERVGAQGGKARAAADALLVDRVARVLGGPVPTALKLKQRMQAALGQLSALADTTALRSVLTDLDPLLFPQAYVDDVKNVLDRALQGLPFGGRNILFDGASARGSGASDFQQAATHLGPTALTQTALDDNGRLVQAHTRTHGACSLAEAAVIVLVAEMDETLLDRSDVEGIAATTRAAIQQAIADMRAAAPGGQSADVGAALRALAFEVQQAAVAVIERRPPVVTRVAPLTGPLRLLAHALYGDHERATELARLNAFGRQLEVQAGQVLRAYAR